MEEMSHGNRGLPHTGLLRTEREIRRNTGYARAVYVVDMWLKELGLGSGSFYRQGEIARSKGKKYWSE